MNDERRKIYELNRQRLLAYSSPHAPHQIDSPPADGRVSDLERGRGWEMFKLSAVRDRVTTRSRLDYGNR